MAQRKWIVRPAVAAAPEVIAAVGGHPLVAQLLAQRGITTPATARAFLDPDSYTPAPPGSLFGLEHAAQVLHAAIEDGQRILVWGDFDVDGQTSTALLVTALRGLLGEKKVTFVVPNRFSDGHGMRVPRLSAVLDVADPMPELIITCDTGIADPDGVAYAKDRGLKVIITDHHDLPEELKQLTPGVDPIWGMSAAEVGVSVRRADAILDPMLSPPDAPLRTLPGVGVAFKLMQRVYELCDKAGAEEELLDLVALGIVADVATQVLDVRYLLQRGLEKLRTTEREGLIALMEVARVHPQQLTAESIGFQLGPRLNALGRLEDATPSIEMLSTRDIFRARQLAGMLEGLNQERRRLTRQTVTEALAMANGSPHLLDYNALVLAHDHWHAGIVGIVASRLVEEFGKPALLLLTPPGEPARGSARSIPGVDIGAAIAACSHLLLTHGGHAGAAGVSLLPENIERFRAELSRQVELHRDPDFEEGLQLDAELNFSEITLDLVREINRLAPFGAGNPVPRFLTRNLTVRTDQRLGAEGLHRRLVLAQAQKKGKEQTLPLIWFNGGDAEVPVGQLDAAYTLGINTYRGEEALQLQYVALRAAESVVTAPGGKWRAPAVVHDLRGKSVTLNDVPAPQEAAWYAEGIGVGEGDSPAPYASRADAVKAMARTLVFWSIPPSQEVHQWLLDSVQPEIVYVCGQQTTVDKWESIRYHVSRMCRYAPKNDGKANLHRMAARLGITEAIVRQTLLWLECDGKITLHEWLEGDDVRITTGNLNGETTNAVTRCDDLEEIEAQVNLLIREMQAYRTFYLRESLDSLGFRKGRAA